MEPRAREQTDIDAATRVTIAPGVHARVSGDELVILDFGRGEYFALGEVGSAIWADLERGEPLGKVAETIASRHEVTPAGALADVVALVADLLRQGLVVRSR